MTQRAPQPGEPPLMSDDVLEAVARRFRALSSPNRLRILRALMPAGMTMGELAAATGIEQSNLTRQVDELEQGRCVARSRTGRNIRVEIIDPTVFALCELVCGSLPDSA